MNDDGVGLPVLMCLFFVEITMPPVDTRLIAYLRYVHTQS